MSEAATNPRLSSPAPSTGVGASLDAAVEQMVASADPPLDESDDFLSLESVLAEAESSAAEATASAGAQSVAGLPDTADQAIEALDRLQGDLDALTACAAAVPSAAPSPELRSISPPDIGDRTDGTEATGADTDEFATAEDVVAMAAAAISAAAIDATADSSPAAASDGGAEVVHPSAAAETVRDVSADLQEPATMQELDRALEQAAQEALAGAVDEADHEGFVAPAEVSASVIEPELPPAPVLEATELEEQRLAATPAAQTVELPPAVSDPVDEPEPEPAALAAPVPSLYRRVIGRCQVRIVAPALHSMCNLAPGTRQTIGWISLMTFFAAGCLWVFIAVRPAYDPIKAREEAIEHAKAELIAAREKAAAGEGGGHGADAKKEGAGKGGH